jgi:PPOX class probable F420-dependent enzyme
MSRRMTREEALAFLAEGTRTAKLATVTADGRPHVVPVWFVLDGAEIVFTTGRDTVKGRNLLRDGRVCLCVDDERSPFAYVQVRGPAAVAERAPDLLEWATRIAERYVGAEQAGAYGKRNAVDTELLVRVRPEKTIALDEIAGW